VRKVTRAKKGQRVVVAIDKTARQSIKRRQNSRYDGPRQPQITTLPKALTPEDIRLEALSCPFDFLPFFHW